MPTRPPLVDAMTMRKIVDQIEGTTKEKKELELKEQKTKAEENIKFLSEWDEEEKKRLESIQERLQASRQPATKKQTVKSEKISEDERHYLSRAAYYARNRQIRDATEMYEGAYSAAVKANGSFTRLAALDGQLFLKGRTLRTKVQQIAPKLATRLKNFRKLSWKKVKQFKN